MSTIDTAVIADLLRESLAGGQTPFLTIKSDSMAPLLVKGDRIRVKGIERRELRPGDIVVKAGDVELLTHRYWRTIAVDSRPFLVTRGDRPLTFDQPWPAERLLGRVDRRRRGRRFLDLDNGLGGWLNRHLAQLARLEMRLTRRWLPVTAVRPDLAAAGLPSHSSVARLSLPLRLLRRLVRTWAWLLVQLVTLITLPDSLFKRDV